MNIKSLIFAVVETIIKVVVLAAVIMLIIRGVRYAYDFGYRVFAEEPVTSGTGRTITIGVADSATVKDVAEMLEEKGLIRDAKLFVIQERLSSFHDEIKPGIYDLNTSMNASEMLRIMSGGGSGGLGDEELNAEDSEPEFYDELQDVPEDAGEYEDDGSLPIGETEGALEEGQQ